MCNKIQQQKYMYKPADCEQIYQLVQWYFCSLLTGLLGLATLSMVRVKGDFFKFTPLVHILCYLAGNMLQRAAHTVNMSSI